MGSLQRWPELSTDGPSYLQRWPEVDSKSAKSRTKADPESIPSRSKVSLKSVPSQSKIGGKCGKHDNNPSACNQKGCIENAFKDGFCISHGKHADTCTFVKKNPRGQKRAAKKGKGKKKEAVKTAEESTAAAEPSLPEPVVEKAVEEKAPAAESAAV